MKKIVALALSLVMVLGLATTAFAVTTYNNLYFKGTAEGATAVQGDLTMVDAKAPEYNKDGSLKAAGNVVYFTTTASVGNYVQVATLGEADLVVYKDAALKVVYMYLDQVEVVSYVGDGAVFANFGEKCGQVNYAGYDKTATYYTCNGALYKAVKTGADNGLMVGGKLVAVAGVDAVSALTVKHTPAYTWTDGKVVAVECSVCGAKATEAPNFMSIPEKGVERVDGTLWYFGAGAAAGDATVESAKTFDAGIAMYVGMSVMAAAGSAVVLKKKD